MFEMLPSYKIGFKLDRSQGRSRIGLKFVIRQCPCCGGKEEDWSKTRPYSILGWDKAWCQSLQDVIGSLVADFTCSPFVPNQKSENPNFQTSSNSTIPWINKLFCQKYSALIQPISWTCMPRYQILRRICDRNISRCYGRDSYTLWYTLTRTEPMGNSRWFLALFWGKM